MSELTTALNHSLCTGFNISELRDCLVRAIYVGDDVPEMLAMYTFRKKLDELDDYQKGIGWKLTLGLIYGMGDINLTLTAQGTL